MAALCKAVCGGCRRQFPYPLLSDIVYGQFILKRVDGQQFLELASFGEPAWDDIAHRISSDRVQVVEVVEVVARVADVSDGLGFTASFVCPHCQSSEFKSWDGECLGPITLEPATFETFLSLNDNDNDKQAWIREIESELEKG